MNESEIVSFKLVVCPAGWRDWFFLILTTPNGEQGISEFTESHGPKYGLLSCVHELSSQIVGQDCRRVDEIVATLRRRNRQSLGGPTWKAISAIENALWDLRSKIEGTRILDLLEIESQMSSDGFVQSYWSHCGTTRVRAASIVGKRPVMTLEDLWDLGTEVHSKKFQAFKTNFLDFQDVPTVRMPGFSPEFESPPLIDYSFKEVLKASLNAFTHNGELSAKPILDWNYNVDPDSYRPLLEAVSCFTPRWVEIDFSSPADLLKIPKDNNVRICTGENLLGIDSYEPYLQSDAISVISIDLLWNGLSESLKIAKRAHVLGKKITIHNYYSHFATSMALTFYEFFSHLDLLEFDLDDVQWRDSIVERSITLVDGNIKIERHLGWGNAVKEEVISKISSPRVDLYRNFAQSLT